MTKIGVETILPRFKITCHCGDKIVPLFVRKQYLSKLEASFLIYYNIVSGLGLAFKFEIVDCIGFCDTSRSHKFLVCFQATSYEKFYFDKSFESQSDPKAKHATKQFKNNMFFEACFLKTHVWVQSKQSSQALTSAHSS